MLMNVLTSVSFLPTALEMQVVVTDKYHAQYFFKGSTIQVRTDEKLINV